MIDSIRILGIDYKIIFEDSNNNGMIDIGQVNMSRCTITICSSANSKEHANCVLLHEIIEALNYRLELKLDHNVITSLESSLFQVFSDNPNVVKMFLNDK